MRLLCRHVETSHTRFSWMTCIGCIFFNAAVSAEPTFAQSNNQRLALAAPSNSRDTPSAPIHVESTASPSVTTQESIRWLLERCLHHLPKQFDGDDDWGDTKELWAGIRMRRDGWKIKTNRRRKSVNHGRWVRYQINLPDDPSLRQLEIRDVQPEPTSDEWPFGGYRFTARVNSLAHFETRVERWNLGVQWYSVSTRGKLNASLETTIRFAVVPDYSEVPPSVVAEMNVLDARASLSNLQVDRVSKIGGDVAEELGEVAEKTLIKLWLNKENDRLAGRFNDSIEDNRDDLRFSWTDWWQKH